MCAAGTVQGQPRAELKQGRGVYIHGEGAVNCGTYLETRRELNDTQDYVYFTWVRGYFSARNASAKSVHVGNVEKATVLAYLDKYCRENPLHALFGGAKALYEEVGGER
jgi:hypothetical protein